MINNLTIFITLDESGILTAICPDLNCSVKSDEEENLNQLLSKLDEEIDKSIYQLHTTSNIATDPFIHALYGGLEEYEYWLEDVAADQYKERLVAAFLKAYPKAQKFKEFVYQHIPHIHWDGGDGYEEDKAKEKAAYDGLINEGASSKEWIEFVQWMAIQIGFMPTESEVILGHNTITQQQKYESWVDLGLPIQPLSEIIQQANLIRALNP